ncbi:hypothetical protein HMPREF1555_02253 [Porphyromonas gingivalis F0570]|uniref:Uncharacterized protein n=1 Tax=Porphyromonas gingivalis F0570 TaxID=1227271 RepID=A0A0E2LN23_PORGN|nr:hypothetical protein HMPREF1555_02253 [Porphyromonas gingivalis F0570]
MDKKKGKRSALSPESLTGLCQNSFLAQPPFRYVRMPKVQGAEAD